MKNYQIVLMIVCFLGAFVTSGQNWQIEWEKELGNGSLDYFEDVVEDLNGGYTVLGAIQPEGANSHDYWLIHFSAAGDEIWSNTFGSEFFDIPDKLIQNADGTYLVLGSKNDGKKDMVQLIKVDEKGEVLWEKNFDDQSYYKIEDLISFGAENYLVAGSKSIAENDGKLWLAQLNGKGEIVWERILAADLNGCCKSVKTLPDGGFAVAAQIEKENSNETGIWVMRANSKGEEVWKSIVSTPGLKVWPECICCTPDSCFMIAGWQGTCLGDINAENPVFDYDIFISKLNCTGEVLLTKQFDSEGSEGANFITRRPSGEFVVGGIKATSFMGRIGPWIILLDENGNLLGEKLIDLHFNNDQAKKVLNSKDGGLVVIGPGFIDKNYFKSNGWIMKFATL